MSGVGPKEKPGHRISTAVPVREDQHSHVVKAVVLPRQKIPRIFKQRLFNSTNVQLNNILLCLNITNLNKRSWLTLIQIELF